MVADRAEQNLGIGGHQRAYEGRTDDWLTPPEIISALGPFDLDPCASRFQPWSTASTQWTSSGLEREWKGRVWLNPPYGPETGKWLKRLADHGDGIALIFARTETRMFFESVWPHSHSLLFLEGRLHFHLPGGKRANHNSGGPSVLIAYGPENGSRLAGCGIPGAYVALAEKRIAPVLHQGLLDLA